MQLSATGWGKNAGGGHLSVRVKFPIRDERRINVANCAGRAEEQDR